MVDKRLKMLISVDSAVELLTKALSESIKLDIEEVRVLEGLGRILAEDIRAPIDVPPFNRSAVDGYAVYAGDVVNASIYNPVELVLKGAITPSDTPPDRCIEPGEAVRVHTGSPIPCGANAVVMDEDTETHGGRLVVYKPVSPGQNISRRGEDFGKGEIVASTGTILNPAHVAALSSIGLDRVRVYRRIRVGVLTSGNEVCEPGVVSECPTLIYNSSARLIVALLEKDGFHDVKYYGVFPDDPHVLSDALLKAVDENDLVVTTGGTGVSEGDALVESIMEVGRVVFRGVKMRPGRPTSLTLVNGKPVLNLSGYPVAAWTGYEAILRPALREWLGLKGFTRPVVYAKLARRVPNAVGYRSYIRVLLRDEGGEYLVEPYMLRGSGVLSSLLRSHGYIVIPENVEGLEKDSLVAVHLL